MTLIRTLIALLACLLPAASTEEIWLTGAHITAGDLAALIPQWQAIPASTPLAPSPLPGISRRVTRSQLLSWARTHGVDAMEATVPADLLVERKTRRLDQAEFLAIIHEAIGRKYAQTLEAVRFHPEGFIEPIVPAGPLKFDVAGALTLNQTRTTRLRWTEPGGRTGGANIRGRVEITADYLRAKSDIAAGAELRPSDIETVRGPLPGLAKTYISRVAEFSGMASRHQISSGDPIVREDLIPAIVVHRGDLVELRLTSGAVRLRTSARAEQDGSIGASVRCKNLQSNRLIEATVLSARVVEVNER